MSKRDQNWTDVARWVLQDCDDTIRGLDRARDAGIIDREEHDYLCKILTDLRRKLSTRLQETTATHHHRLNSRSSEEKEGRQ